MQRIAVIDRDLCTKEKCGYVCMKICPVNRMGQECITKDEEGFPVISEQLCVGCGICPKKCPANAITIINLAKEVGKPVYQYGVNQFRIYSVPSPQEGVSGIIGKNGIGKTTALNILAGKITPNIDGKKKLTYEEMLEEIPLSLKRYLLTLKEDAKLSYKPQMVEKIRRIFKGTVEELLKKMDERGSFKEAVEKFNLSKILSRKIDQLSGGELQRVSIAVGFLKDADIYYFDEPSNYLDIEERLRMAVALKSFSEGRKLMVVEHDLAILDYMSDYIYIFFGEENTYGVSSSVKGTRNGINEYLNGFLKEENIRFRDREIRFSTYSEREIYTETRFKFGEMQKSYPGFTFHSSAGEIMKGEVIGIVGKNALGKSIFVKMLAGVEKPDKGEPAGQFRVSYKPQYIRAEEGALVKDLFDSDEIDELVFNNAKRELKLIPLLEKELTSLSGGELQRVAVSLALSRKADLYLFDEPTAYLDIEQRLRFGDLLRHTMADSNKSAFIVDHDIVFLDSVANRLMVFEGESSVYGKASKPYDKTEGMNNFLSLVNITMRRDKDSKRPRINKPDSVLDREQRKEGRYYY